MNKTKRRLIIGAGVVNIIYAFLILGFVLLLNFQPAIVEEYYDYFYILVMQLYSPSIIFNVVKLIICVVGSILLFYSVRNKGKFYRTSVGAYFTGFILVIIFGSFVAWILLMIAAFTSNIIVNDFDKETKFEKQEEVVDSPEYAQKKAKIDELKRLRDTGAIDEDEYKKRLFELL